MLHKSDLNDHKGKTRGLSLWAHLCIYPHRWTLFPPSKYFTCFTTFCLYGNSFLQSQRARALSLTTGLVGRTWCFHCSNPPHSLARKPNAHFKLLQVEATKDQFLFSFPIASLFWLTTIWIYPLIIREGLGGWSFFPTYKILRTWKRFVPGEVPIGSCSVL